MADNRLIYRSLGVPDIIDDGSKPRAAAHRLAEAAGLDVSVDPTRSQQSRIRLEDARSVIVGAGELIVAGELDGFVGAFGYHDEDWYVAQLIRRTDLHVYEQGLACARALLCNLRTYVASHPFEDDAGRPFS